ncbi:NAD(P)/FAD-dependent oxidoreductase [Siphonobacter sp. SORGH_AS_0500]|uniref:FAD-dependent oxidoreductase n=1 Tax=Siphonobacter sp. SORGH_AS_0500 TaxID=1864824 RepID=UPI000D0ECBA2|nr:NAD(P)/FAD-dependent oxidoreductase [Siphonobacter sp. SORGH_AS_0500]
MILTNKKIAVIGAGPVGLTMARLLQQHHIDVTVYERDAYAEARIWGGTLDLHKNSGQEAMKAAGLLESYYAQARPMGRTIVDEKGKVLAVTEPTPENRFDNPEINRNDLRKMLLESLATDTVVWDRKCTGLQEHHGKWLLSFEHQIQAEADVVIVANGGMSGIRRLVTDAEVEETGSFIIQGEIVEPEKHCPEFYRLCNDTILMSSYQGNVLVVNPNNKGALTYGIIAKKPDDWAFSPGPAFRDDIMPFLSSRFRHWGECYQQLFRVTPSFWALPIRKLPLTKPWKTNRPLPITLIGDAAHLMPPFAGKGVNTGLEDALLLAHNLTNGKFESIDAAIQNYEERMMIYASAAQQESIENERMMIADTFSFS